MSYMEMQLKNEMCEAITKGICLNFGNFIDDLNFSSDMNYYQLEEYPIERYHAKMSELLENTEHRQQKVPLLFSIPLEEEMTFLNCTFCYQFIVMETTRHLSIYPRTVKNITLTLKPTLLTCRNTGNF